MEKAADERGDEATANAGIHGNALAVFLAALDKDDVRPDCH